VFPEVVGECRRMLPRRGIVCVCAGGARWCCPILWSKYDMDGVLSVAACTVVWCVGSVARCSPRRGAAIMVCTFTCVRCVLP
jgi:hypothetical protein